MFFTILWFTQCKSKFWISFSQVLFPVYHQCYQKQWQQNPEFQLTLAWFTCSSFVALSLCFVQILVQMCAVSHFSARLATLGSWWYKTKRQNSWRICNSEWGRAETRPGLVTGIAWTTLTATLPRPCSSSWSEDEPGPPKLRPLFASSVLLESFDSLFKRRGTSPSKSLWIFLLISSTLCKANGELFALYISLN